MTHPDEPFIARLKQLESAWIHHHITSGEYHSLLDYYLWRLAEDELHPCRALPFVLQQQEALSGEGAL